MKTNAFKKCFSLFLSMLLLLGVAPFRSFAAAAELQQNDDDLYINLPASGTDTLDLTGKTAGFTFKIYDNGGADENYSNSCNGTLLITAPDGCLLKIGGSGNTESGYDYLYIYDGDTNVSLGEEKYSGSFTVHDSYSSGNVLKVRFYSDSSYNNAGLELTVTLVDQNSMAKVTYSFAGSERSLVESKNTQITLPVFTDLFTAPAGATFLGWKQGETLYNEGDTFTITENVTFFAQVEEPPVVLGNDTDGWYANMPVTGTATADLSDKSDGFSLHVYDDGGAENVYSNNCSGYLRIVAPEGFVLKVSGGGRSESASYDYLIIYDGDTTNVLGNAKYAGRPFTVPELITTGNVLKLFFRSDSSDTYDGFDLTVTLIDYSNYSLVTYSYDGATNAFFAQNGTDIELSAFTSMFTLPERYHFTCWQSGGVDYAQGETYTVTADVTFTALIEEDPVIFEDGEGGYYAKLPKTGTLTADLSDWNAGDTIKVYDNGGKDKPYSYSCNGYLQIIAPEGYRLLVNGTYSTYSYYDWIYLYDGDTSAQLGPQFMGYNKTMFDYYTTGNVLIVYLYSYYGDTNKGCDLTVTIVDPDDLVSIAFAPGDGSGEMTAMQALNGSQIVLPECGFTLPEKTYFDYYTDGTNTYSAGSVYTVTGDATLTAVYIEKIIATYQLGEQTATAEHRKGSRIDLPYFTEYFTLPYRTEFYRWASGGNEYYERQSYTFNEDVTFTAILNNLPVLIEKDDGSYYATLPKNEHVQADLSTGYTNGLTFTLYDNGNEYGDYASNCDGSLTFTAPAGYIFLISGSIDSEANFDVLSIYDSDLTSLLGEQSYSGKTTIGPLQSSTNKFKVHYATDSSGNYAGFALTVRMIDLSTLITVSFDAGEGASGTMETISALAGVAFTLPDYGFTAPEGKIFSGYSDGTNVYWPGTVTFNESKTLTALWEAATGITYSCNGEDKAIRYALGSTVTLPELTDLFTLPDGLEFVGWTEKFSGDLYQAGDPYIVNSPTVFTAVLEFLKSDGNGGWYANMPVNNPNDVLTLDLSEKPSGFSFVLYDAGGADGDYSEYNNGVLVVKAPENMVVAVSGNGQIENNYDFLRFYDGGTSNSSILGNSKYTGTFSIDEDEPLFSTGNYLMIYFCSDSSFNYAGFALTITVVALNQITYMFDGETQNVAIQKDSTIQLKYFDDLFASDTKEFICWQIGDDTYDEGDEYYISEDVTVTAITRLMPTVTLDGNGATVIGYDDLTVFGPISFPTGTTELLPHANMIFASPENMYFGGWMYNERIYNVGEKFTLTEDVTLTAIWREASAWELLNEQLQTASGTITLTEDVTAEIGSTPLIVPEGVTVTVDLNGHTLEGANAAVINGNIITVRGELTITDTRSSGAFTGGCVTVYTGGVFTADDSVAALFAATVTQRYRANDDDYNYENYIYSVSWYPTLADALEAASVRPNYEDSLTLPEGMTFRWYLMPKVTLLQDVTVAEDETLEIDTDEGIDLDLNGHTFDVQGTFTGGTTFWRYNDGDLEEVFNPTDVSIDSTTPGVFRSSGTINVNLSPWTEDTYYFTGGTVTGFMSADGGIFHISGGHFTEIVMFNNGNDEANLEIEISGNAEFDRLEHMIYANDGGPTIHMTISENARIRAMLFEIMGEGTLTYPVLTVNGGYFSVDPQTWQTVPGVGTNMVEIQSNPEEYSGQTDWAADETVYTWRVAASGPSYDLNNDGETDVNDVTALLNYIAGNGNGDYSVTGDFNGDNEVDVTDVTSLLNFIALA